MNIKNKLHKNEVVLVSWITLAHPGIAEIMASSGFDWLAIDLEHSTITIKEAEELIRVISLSNVTPLCVLHPIMKNKLSVSWMLELMES